MPLNDDIMTTTEAVYPATDMFKAAEPQPEMVYQDTDPQPEVDWERGPIRADTIYSGTVSSGVSQPVQPWDAPGRIYGRPIPAPVYGGTVIDRISDDIFEQLKQEKKRHTTPEIKNSRTICSVFSSMRACLENLNFSLFKPLIEEAQDYANRMEDGLQSTRDTAVKIYRVNENEDLTPENKQAMIRNLLTKRYDFDRWELGS